MGFEHEVELARLSELFRLTVRAFFVVDVRLGVVASESSSALFAIDEGIRESVNVA